jgi:hypothetical protein
VIFFAAVEDDPIILPKIMPAEGFPLWIKRTTVAGAEAVENDGFRLRMVIDSLNPSLF